jgi:mRNA degradation ribonuclease J1/J2
MLQMRLTSLSSVILKPKNIFPAHAGREKQLALCELAKELGYKSHLMEDGKKITIQ